MPKLGVNVDHVATLRQARRGLEPDPVWAAQICERAGAHSIVAHLREDRRHINDRDIKRLKEAVTTSFNLEMSLNKGIVEIALGIGPNQVTLVPERRQEITTEGGLDVEGLFSLFKKIVPRLKKQGIEVSLFIDPIKTQIQKSHELGVATIELHTGAYANAKNPKTRMRALDTLKAAAAYTRSLGLQVNAGHGLNYENAQSVAEIEGIEELNIGHAIISRAVFVGLERAVREMAGLIR